MYVQYSIIGIVYILLYIIQYKLYVIPCILCGPGGPPLSTIEEGSDADND